MDKNEKQNIETINNEPKEVKDFKFDSQARNWCFTVNNPVQAEDDFYSYLQSLSNIRYFTFQRETAPETQTPHYQGYFEFTAPKKFSTVRNLLSAETIGVQAHIQARKGPRQKARDYCQKAEGRIGDNYYEFGDFVEEADSKRTDLSEIMDDVESGMSNVDLAKKHKDRYVRVSRWVDTYRDDYLMQKHSKDRRLDLEVTYLYSDTGIGKTRYVLDKYGDDKVFIMSEYGSHFSRERFDGYKGERIILFEEFRSSIPITNIQQIR